MDTIAGTLAHACAIRGTGTRCYGRRNPPVWGWVHVQMYPSPTPKSRPSLAPIQCIQGPFHHAVAAPASLSSDALHPKYRVLSPRSQPPISLQPCDVPSGPFSWTAYVLHIWCACMPRNTAPTDVNERQKYRIKMGTGTAHNKDSALMAET